jgi:hypothetical protein
MLKAFDDPEWKASFEYDLKQHMPYICQVEDPAFFEQYYEKMRTLLKQAKAKCQMPPHLAGEFAQRGGPLLLLGGPPAPSWRSDDP